MTSQIRTARKFEERIANLIGGVRRGKQHYGHSTHDVESDLFVGECKLREKLALETWMQQVEEHWQEGKMCAVFTKQKRLKNNQTLVTLRLPDFLQLVEVYERWQLMNGLIIPKENSPSEKP
jgi:hypothetical protein